MAPPRTGKGLPRDEVEYELAGTGITRPFRRDWIGESKIVLATYETLRDLEFSIALQKRFGTVCDEAQKIKNPSATVTRAAKIDLPPVAVPLTQQEVRLPEEARAAAGRLRYIQRGQ